MTDSQRSTRFRFFASTAPAVVIFGAALLWMDTGLVVAQANVQPETSAVATSERTVLYSEDATHEQRVDAARSLLSDEKFDDLAACLADPEAARSHRAIATAVAESPAADTPDRLRLLLASMLSQDGLDLETRRAILATLQSRLDRASIRPVVESLRDGLDGPAQQATIAALVQQTGRDDIGAEPDRWQEWWRSIEWLTEPEWKSRQSEAHARRAQRLKTERDHFETRWIESLRSIHVLTPPAERSQLLQSLLAHPSVDARRLGLEFVQQAVLNARPPDDTVRDIVIARIEDPDPDVRALAASVATQLAPEFAAPVAVRALATERDSRAAASQLLLLARRPVPGSTDSILSWLNDSGPASTAAATAAGALAEIGRLQKPAERTAARVAARERLAAGDRDPAWIRLLAIAGEWSDVELARRFANDSVAIPSLAERLQDQPRVANSLTPQ